MLVSFGKLLKEQEGIFMGTARHQYTNEARGFGAFDKQWPSVEPDCQRARDFSCATAGLAQQKCREPGGIVAAPKHEGGDSPCWHGFGNRECSPAARERALAHGAGEPKKLYLLVFDLQMASRNVCNCVLPK